MPSLIDLDFLLVPFGVSRIKIGNFSYTGYAVYRIFGIRVAVVQETVPWK